jgi:hypothetical protein
MDPPSRERTESMGQRWFRPSTATLAVDGLRGLFSRRWLIAGVAAGPFQVKSNSVAPVARRLQETPPRIRAINHMAQCHRPRNRRPSHGRTSSLQPNNRPTGIGGQLPRERRPTRRHRGRLPRPAAGPLYLPRRHLRLLLHHRRGHRLLPTHVAVDRAALS